MKEWLAIATEHTVIVISFLALIVIFFGTLQAFFRSLYVAFGLSAAHDPRDIWLRYARWLVAGLTFQLAADILETSIAPSWDELGKLAAIAAIRTFLNYFLERDLAELREHNDEATT